MRKNIDISDFAVEEISIQAVKNKSNFKKLAESILEMEAIKLHEQARPLPAWAKPKKPFMNLKNSKSVGKKRKNI